MSTPDDPLEKSLEFAEMFQKAKEFTEELLKENERLRFKIAALANGAAADERSRELASRVQELEARLAEVERLVLLTAGHDPAPDDANGAVLCDADLAVLASPAPAYVGYASAVREEYGHLSDAEFTAGRIAVLEHLLALPTLFRTPEARSWEEPARANLAAELSLLRART